MALGAHFSPQHCPAKALLFRPPGVDCGICNKELRLIFSTIIQKQEMQTNKKKWHLLAFLGKRDELARLGDKWLNVGGRSLENWSEG